MEDAVIYIHGMGGCAEEAIHYRSLFPDRRVIGFAYQAQTPWEAKEEFPVFFDSVAHRASSITIVANSIGAFFAMEALSDRRIEKAFFLSPIVDMEKLICDRMLRANVTEEALRLNGELTTEFGDALSWKYLCYVREHPICWPVPTHILYGGKDHFTSLETMTGFADRIGATLTVLENGEHWFHTEEQMLFLDRWIASIL